MKVNPVFRDVGMSKIVEVSERARLLAPDFEKQSGKSFIYFQRGEVGYKVAPFILDGYKEAIEKGFTKYPKSGGESFFKDAIAEYYADLNLDPENIIAVHGGQEGLQLIFNLYRGKKCAILTPCWSCMFDNIFPYTETEFVSVPLIKRGWQIDFDLLEKTFKRDDVEMFYFNSPHNPTGRVFPREDIDRLLLLCAKYGILFISDEAYSELAYSGTHYSPLENGEYENVVSINTFSKSFAATGFRVGYVISRRTDIIENLVKGNYTQTAGVATPTQYAFSKALLHPARNEWMQSYRKEMSARAEVLADVLDPIFDAHPPEGAFYSFFRPVEMVDNISYLDQEFAVCDRLMKNGIAVVPGSAFGEDFKGYVRLSFSTLNTEIIREGAQRFNEVILGS